MVSTLLSFWHDASKQQQLLKEFKHAKLGKPNAILGGQSAHIDQIQTNAYLTHHFFQKKTFNQVGGGFEYMFSN